VKKRRRGWEEKSSELKGVIQKYYVSDYETISISEVIESSNLLALESST
jgi:hypothetical protein